jgi:hypothetical protein
MWFTTKSDYEERKEVKAVLLDTLSVFWPAAVVWLIINWTIL